MSSTAEAQARARVGTLIKDRWHLDALLGLGGMAWVYSATHRNKNRVAIKLLIPQLSHSADITRRFLREGYAANSIAHPGAVTVFDDDVTEDGLAFLVMELLEGKTLAQLRRDAGGRLEPRVVLEHADKVLDILAAAHEHGVIHRDIKPSNVFVTHNGTLKVLDFGIARICEAEQDLESTQTGMLLGSAPFMPPEQARGRWEMVDARTDLWSMGATMFQLLAGRAVHEAGTPQERLLAAMSTHARSLGSLVPNMPQAVVRLVDRALRFDRDDRWQTAREMQSAVRSALTRMGSLGGTLVLGGPPPEISSPFVTPAPMSPPDEGEPAPPAAVSAPAGRPAANALGATRLGFALDPATGSAADPARPAAAPRSLGETATYGSPLHAGLLPPIPAPKGLTSEAQDAQPEAIRSPQLASFSTESAPAPAPPVFSSKPEVIPVSPDRASRPQVVESPDASTAAAGAVTRDRPRSTRKQSGLMLAGVAAIIVGALLLTLAGLGLWQMQRQAKQVTQEQSALGALAEPPTPSAAAPRAEPPSVDAPPTVAPLPSTSSDAADAGPSAESGTSVRGGAKSPKALKKPKADTYR